MYFILHFLKPVNAVSLSVKRTFMYNYVVLPPLCWKSPVLKGKKDKTHFYTGYNSIKLEIAKLLE